MLDVSCCFLPWLCLDVKPNLTCFVVLPFEERLHDFSSFSFMMLGVGAEKP